MAADGVPPFVHLHVHSGFSRLDGASTPDALAARAAALGQPALALTDHDTLSGVVPFLQACRRHGLKAIVGAEVTMQGWVGGGGATPTHLLLLAPDPAGYAALCRLISRAHLEHPRGQPLLTRDALEQEAPALIGLSAGRSGEIGGHILAHRWNAAEEAAAACTHLFGPDRFYLELPADRLPGNGRLIRTLQELGERLHLPTVATGNVHYATADRAWVSDLLTCVRLRCRLEDLPPERAPGAFNAERNLKGAAEVLEAVGDAAAVARSAELARCCALPLDLSVQRYPRFPVPGGVTPEAELRRQVEEGARWRYGRQKAATIEPRLSHELSVIERLGFCDYFLCVADLARWARGQGIRVAGRGSAADSAVAYVLGITDVDAATRGHLFERFLSEERAEAPDIDLDFDSRHRDRVAEYVITTYGQERVCAVGAHNTWCARSAVRELGKVLGFPADELDMVSKRVPYYTDAENLRVALEAVPELRDLPVARGRLQALARAAAAVSGLPRFLSTHLGGLCITPGPTTDLMPVQRSAKGVVVAQWDKRDLEAAGLLKLDLLSLRTLGAVDDAVRIAGAAGVPVDYEGIPEDDPATFARLRRGATVGVFQLESAAQMALQVRLGADRMEDVIASVALIRPGPIKGNMVDPFVARRRGREPVTYPHPGLEAVLRRTYGVVVYQEQVISIAVELAGFSPGEADRLRRVMSHARSPKEMEGLGRLFVERAVARGVEAGVAERIFACLQGYASYGFPEAHAVAFGVTAYRTAYLAEHRPAAYFAGLLNLQPMGFYPAHTLVGELRRRGVTVMGPDLERSGREWGPDARPPLPPAPPRSPDLPAGGGSEGTELLPPGPPRQGPPDAAAGAGAATASRTGPRPPDLPAVRAPLWAVSGVGRADADAIVDERERGGVFGDLLDLCQRVPGVGRDVLEALILAGAGDGWEDALVGGHAANRRILLWSLSAAAEVARSGGLALLPPPPALPDLTPREKWLAEERLLGWSPRGHIMALVRAELDLEARGYLRTGQARSAPDGQRLSVAGVPVRPHRPPTRSGQRLVFVALEDDEGLMEVMVPEEVYRRDGAVLFPAAPVLAVHGLAKRRGTGMSMVAERVGALLGE